MPTLDFKGKQFVYAHHLGVPFKQLDIDAKKSAPAKGSKPSLDDNPIQGQTDCGFSFTESKDSETSHCISC